MMDDVIWDRSTCEACGEVMVVFEAGQRTHRDCDREKPYAGFRSAEHVEPAAPSGGGFDFPPLPEGF